MKLKVDSLQRSNKIDKTLVVRKNRLKLWKSEMKAITDSKNKDYKREYEDNSMPKIG